jgi:apolipoprotein D and lipocalin family protein
MTVKLISSALLLTAVLLGCMGVPKGLKPVSEFDGQRYMGKWYEIARLDHSFERNLSNVSATYAIDSAGVISVINRGYNEKTGEWKQIEGRARFIGDNTVGSLKVSFFGPFYGGYHVIALDKENYSYAMVAGPNLSYLWILSRSTSLDESILSNLTGKAAEWGFETSELIAIRHDRDENS